MFRMKPIKIKRDANMMYDLFDLVGSKDRDFLIRNNGDQVKISSLKANKTVGIYLCCSQRDCEKIMTPRLLQFYSELTDSDFEIVMLWMGRSCDNDCLFDATFAQMPWLAVPESDSSSAAHRYMCTFDIYASVTNFSIFDKNGAILMPTPNRNFYLYGTEAYPFTRERFLFLKQQDAVAHRNQTITSLLGDEFEHLVGYTVVLYFQPYRPDVETSELLARVYTQLKERGEKFEVVMIPEVDVGDFDSVIKTMQWLVMPKTGKRTNKLWLRAEFRGRRPFMEIIKPNARVLDIDVATLLRRHGVEAFPFTRGKLKKLDRLKDSLWTWETLLDFHGRDFVIRKDGSKVALNELVGKTVMLYFLSSWRISAGTKRHYGGASIGMKSRFGSTSIGVHKFLDSCRGIRVKDNAFEVICVGFCERDLDMIDEWMFALPPKDLREFRLIYFLAVKNSERAILLDSSCQFVDCEDMCVYGAEAYPFTADHLTGLDQRAEEIANLWPEKVKHEIHEHEISRVVCDVYDCDACYRSRNHWNFMCTQCNRFNLHENYSFGKDNDCCKPDGRQLMDRFVTWGKDATTCLVGEPLTKQCS